MVATTVSELENWDGRRDEQRQNSKRPTRTSSDLARNPHHTSPNSQPVENARPPGRLFHQKRVERSSFHSSFERDSFTNSSANRRLSSRVDTTSMSSHDMHRSHRLSISSNASCSRLQFSSFSGSPMSSHTTPDSSVHVSRVHKPQRLSSSQHIPLSKNNSQVIDLTIEDTEDELLVGDKLVPDSTRSRDQHADPGPSRRRSISESSPPMALEESLFTPPPPSRRRVRLLLNYLAMPPFPGGLTKADYRPMSEYLDMPLPPSRVPKHTPRPESPVVEQQIDPSKGKEREHTVSDPCTDDKQLTPPADADLCVVLDVFDEPTMIPLQDDGTYPPLTALNLGINTRFYFVHAWRANASKLQEVDWTLKILGKPCVWAQSVGQSSPRSPGITGYVSSKQLRSWELVPPEGSLPEEEMKDVLEKEIQVESHTVDVDHARDPNVVDSPPSDPAASSSTVVGMDHDMNKYFDGLGDSPHRQPPAHTFRPHLLQSAERAQMNTFGLDFPLSELSPRLGDTGGNECFLGVPPSPTTEDIGPSVATQLSHSPFAPASYFPTSPSHAFPGDAPPAAAWAFEQGDDARSDHGPSPSNHVSSVIPGTIDPSLLGLEQPRAPSVTRKDATLKRRPKLPEPVIYVRRPMDPSSLPLLSGKRSVQIKYRDAEGSSMPPSTQTKSNDAPSNAVNSPGEASTNDGDDLPRVKRRSVPTRKLAEARAASESDSSTSRINTSKFKRPSGKAKAPVSDVDVPETESAPTMSYCHQCRNKTARPKMRCSNVTKDRVCGKRFCNRCILYRYPDVTFDAHSAGFLCPVCTHTCNCSHCSRHRGEEFVSMRLGGFAASLFTAKVTLVRDGGRAKSPSPRPEVAPRTPTPETGTPATVPTSSRFWAHVYGMEGERMGRAFMTRAQLAGGATSKTTGEMKGKTRRRRARVFVGAPLASWKVRAVRTLDVDVGATVTRRRRYYIGNRAALHEPYGRMPGASTLTSRCSTPGVDSEGKSAEEGEDGEGEGEGEGDWPQPDVGEYCSWAPWRMVAGSVSAGMDVEGPAGLDASVGMDVDVNGDEREPVTRALSEADMARAISAALAALSVDPPPL